jgi:hypothetical protein
MDDDLLLAVKFQRCRDGRTLPFDEFFEAEAAYWRKWNARGAEVLSHKSRWSRFVHDGDGGGLSLVEQLDLEETFQTELRAFSALLGEQEAKVEAREEEARQAREEEALRGARERAEAQTAAILEKMRRESKARAKAYEKQRAKTKAAREAEAENPSKPAPGPLTARLMGLGPHPPTLKRSADDAWALLLMATSTPPMNARLASQYLAAIEAFYGPDSDELMKAREVAEYVVNYVEEEEEEEVTE